MPGFFGALAAAAVEIPAAVSVVTSNSVTDTGNGPSYTFSVPLTGDWDGLIICLAARGSGRTVDSVTVNGNAWTKGVEEIFTGRTSTIGAIKLPGFHFDAHDRRHL